MGMDVCGRKPSTPQGEYFSNNVWWWRPLAEYCQEVAPDICDQCELWHFNDGDGLDEKHALQLADALQAELDAGRTALHKTRLTVPDRWGEAEEPYPFDPENVQNFVIFLRGCGGFSIW